MNNFRVGLAGTSQLSFPGDKEGRFRQSVSELQVHSQLLEYELFVYKDTIISESDAEQAVKFFEDSKVDFLLIQCTSFSAGSLIPVLARTQNAAIGLWGIPEGTSEGAVPFNSFCSINMYSSIIGHYLKEYDIQFKWFYGDVNDVLFKKRLEITIRALSAVKKMRSSRIALIGGIAPGFNDLYFDERIFEKQFSGLKINRLHEFSEIKDRALSYKPYEFEDILKQTVDRSKGVHPKSQQSLETNARISKAYKDFVKEYHYDALAVSCWPKFQTDFNFSVCSVVAKLNDDGVVTACEGDLPSAISMLLLKYLANSSTMLMDFSDFDEADQTILMWHCGPAAESFCNAEGYTLGVNYHGLPHEKGKELSCCGVVRDMVFKPQHATVTRLTGEGNRIFLAEGDFIDYKKKSFSGSRGWLGNLKLNRESVTVRDFVNTVLVQRFQHHYPIVGGDYSQEILEMTAWLRMKTVKKVPYQEYMQNCEV